MARSTALIFGEVLFDCFPDGREVLGGAAFNVAWNLAGLGESPIFVSRVGDDERGRRVVAAMDRWGMDRSALVVDPEHATGTVEVSVRDGQPSYEIPLDRAWDHISSPEAISRAARDDVHVGVIYHGSLALRSEASRRALDEVLAALRTSSAPSPPSVFIDVNLRAPFWHRREVRERMAGADRVKLNDEELVVLAKSPARGADSPPIDELARRTLSDCDLERLILTLGARGAVIYRRGAEAVTCEPRTVESVVDTVGAGDALASVMILGQLRGWSEDVTLSRAVELAASVCSLRGAVSEDPDYYRRFAAAWK